MIATLTLTLALLGQAAPVRPLGEPAWGWTVPKDGHAPAGWYRLRRDAAGRYHVFAKDQPSGRFEPSPKPAVNFGLDVNHRTDHGAGEVRGTDVTLGRELSRSLVPHGQAAPKAKPAPVGPCPGPGPCPSPRRPEPKPLPVVPPAPGLNLIVLAAAAGLLLTAGLVGFLALMIFLLYRVQK